MNTYQNFSSPEAGVDPMNHNPFESGDTIEPDFEFESANDDVESTENEKVTYFEAQLEKRDELWDANEKVAALKMNDEIYQEISQAMKDREINPLEAEPLNKNCREFREQPYEDAA